MILVAVDNSQSEKGKQAELPCVLSCSGCSRAGELADHTARLLDRNRLAKMSCLAGVGGRVKSILNTVQAAEKLLMIDGCPLECGARTLRAAGIEKFKHMKLHEHGVKKHSSEVTEDFAAKLAHVAGALFGAVGEKSTEQAEIELPAQV